MPTDSTLTLAIQSQLTTATMLIPRLSHPTFHLRVRILLSVLLLLALGTIYVPIFTTPPTTQLQRITIPNHHNIALATLAYPTNNPLTSQNIQRYATYASHFKHPMHLLTSPILLGCTNKYLHLHHLLVSELQKPVERRVGWILYFDPDVILLDHSVDLKELLPPREDIYAEMFRDVRFVATKARGEAMKDAGEGWEVSSRVFWVRVCSGSVRVLSRAMVRVWDAPDRHGEADGDVCGRGLQSVLEEEGMRGKVVYQPGEWYNGTLFIQIGAEGRKKVVGMQRVLEGLERKEERRGQGLSGDGIRVFWSSLAQARRVLDEVRNGYGERLEKLGEEGRRAYNELKDWVELRAWETEEVMQRTKLVADMMEID